MMYSPTFYHFYILISFLSLLMMIESLCWRLNHLIFQCHYIIFALYNFHVIVLKILWLFLQYYSTILPFLSFQYFFKTKSYPNSHGSRLRNAYENFGCLTFFLKLFQYLIEIHRFIMIHLWTTRFYGFVHSTSHLKTYKKSPLTCRLDGIIFISDLRFWPTFMWFICKICAFNLWQLKAKVMYLYHLWVNFSLRQTVQNIPFYDFIWPYQETY